MDIRRALLTGWLACLLSYSPLVLAEVDGPALYQTHCAKCHGDNGQAATWRGYLYFARNFSDADWQERQTDARILRRINEGPRIMPAYEQTLALPEREALVRVVRGFRAP